MSDLTDEQPRIEVGQRWKDKAGDAFRVVGIGFFDPEIFLVEREVNGAQATIGRWFFAAYCQIANRIG